MKTNVYIDGFNFYYGCLKRTPHKWLDLAAFCQASFPPPRNQINRIRLVDAFDDEYETAVVITNDSDLAEPIRLVRQKFKKNVLVLHPCSPGRKPSFELRKVATKSTIDYLDRCLINDLDHSRTLRVQVMGGLLGAWGLAHRTHACKNSVPQIPCECKVNRRILSVSLVLSDPAV